MRIVQTFGPSCHTVLLLLLSWWLVVDGGDTSLANKLLQESATDGEFMGKLKQQELLHEQSQACGGGIDGQLLGSAMERGFFKSVLNLIRACVESGVNVDSGIHAKANTIRKRVSEVTHLLQSSKSQRPSIVAPAFEWAQSADSVFISLKFSHKMDAPACIDLIDKEIEIQKTSLSVKANCKGKNKQFSLELELLEEIDPETSKFDMQSVGRATFTLMKLEPQLRWERLLKSTEKPRNMRIWLDLSEKYADELDSLSTKQQEQNKDKEENKEATQEKGEQLKENNEPELSEEEKAKQDKIKEVKKQAKVDQKRINKEAKKAIKAIESDKKKKLEELEKEHQLERDELKKKQDDQIAVIENEAKAEREKIEQDKEMKTKKIDHFLTKSLEEIELGKGPGAKLYDAVRSWVFDKIKPIYDELYPGSAKENDVFEDFDKKDEL